ncbi:MAG: hypothetical protein SO435_08820 [Peptostreptococcus porci]|uniref:hypothetical protein n=1 Tax=Peptostreptococcus porci TaxID=2652282 RepID=UPI002A8212B6|nr:hypothetical protein [Peptostreptococcus porci]MDY4127967.1 hypothetical protein [Peptostreptococcus porci]MDY4561804.1 hypothetical protein [Peptostreptococcus porci]
MENNNIKEQDKNVTFLREYLQYVPLSAINVFDYIDSISSNIVTSDNLTNVYLLYESIYKKRFNEELPDRLRDIDKDFYAHLKSIQGIFALGIIMGCKIGKNENNNK